MIQQQLNKTLRSLLKIPGPRNEETHKRGVISCLPEHMANAVWRILGVVVQRATFRNANVLISNSPTNVSINVLAVSNMRPQRQMRILLLSPVLMGYRRANKDRQPSQNHGWALLSEEDTPLAEP